MNLNTNMNKIIIAVIVVAIIIIGGVLLSRGGQQTSAPEGTTQEESAEGEGFVGTIKDAISRGVSMKCTWEDDTGNSAVGYIKGEKYYGEISVESQDGRVIMVDNCMWSWEKDAIQGVKICVEPTEGDLWEQPEGSTSVSTPGYDYNCSPSVVSDSMFTPPADVDFLGMEDMVQGVMKEITGEEE